MGATEKQKGGSVPSRGSGSRKTSLTCRLTLSAFEPCIMPTLGYWVEQDYFCPGSPQTDCGGGQTSKTPKHKAVRSSLATLCETAHACVCTPPTLLLALFFSTAFISI